MKWRRITAALRRRVPPGIRGPIRAALRVVSGFLTTAVVSVFGALLAIAPRAVAIGVRSRLARTATLDYDGAQVNIHVTSAAEGLRIHPCAKEPETVAWIAETVRRGDAFYDIGANIGVYSLIAAAASAGQAKVYAFEPVPATFAQLTANIFLNRREGVIVGFQVALGNATEVAPFEYRTTEAGSADHPGLLVSDGARAEEGGGRARRQGALCYRLDEFVEHFHLEPPTHIKLDVDGSELLVLRGAPRLLRSHQLRSILVEEGRQQGTEAPVRELLAGCGFRLESEHPHAGDIVRNLIFKRVRPPAEQAV